MARTPCHTRKNVISPVFQGVDKEKSNQAFFPVFHPGIFLPDCLGYFASVQSAKRPGSNQ